MLVYRTFEELNQFLNEQTDLGKTIGFVPTMGALHKGHMSLIRESIKLTDVTICSIFVNPTQFNVAEDLEKYPRTEEVDILMLEKNDCDVVIIPSVAEVYPDEYKTTNVNLDGLDLTMEGMGRPGHFDGVVQVVGRFFEQINPDFSFFGEKDFQQLVVVSKMVRARSFKVKIVACEIMREPSGLAMSSRNVRLSKSGLIKAQAISKKLQEVKNQFNGDNAAEIQKQAQVFFTDHPDFKLSYFEIVDDSELQPFTDSAKKARAIVAVELEGIRLLDNLGLN